MEISENVIMIIVLLLGLLLVVANFLIDGAIGSCGSASISRCNKGVLMIGTVSVVVASSYMIAKARCDCGQAEGVDLGLFMTLLTFLGITLVTLGSIIHANSSSTKNTDIEECKKAAKYAPVVWVTGLIMLLLGMAYWGIVIAKTYGKAAAQSEKSGGLLEMVETNPEMLLAV